jgi:hypothetical protein
MRTAMIVQAFDGDHSRTWRNRQPNEIIFTAQRGDTGDTFNAIVPGAMQVQLLAPASRTLPVTGVTRDGEVFHAKLARYNNEATVPAGVYLASVFAVVFVPGNNEFTGTALASVVIDRSLPAIPPPPPPRGPVNPRQAAGVLQGRKPATKKEKS